MINLFLKFCFSLTLISFIIQFMSLLNPFFQKVWTDPKIKILKQFLPSFEGQLGNINVLTSFILTPIFLLVTNLLLLSILIHNWITFKHIPISNLYESLIFLNWLISLINYFINYKNILFKFFQLPRIQNFSLPSFGGQSGRIPWQSKITLPSEEWNIINTIQNQNQPWQKNTSVSSILISCSLCLYIVLFLLPENIKTSNFLVPSLQSNWLFMHVTSIILSYAFLICGTFIALFFLLKKKQNIIGSNQLITLDNLSYRLISIGFPLLTIGIISGAVWANEAWGSYWSWDPKETWALITWILFAIYLHTRLFFNWQGQKSAIIASISLLILLICFFGVNFMSKGLHSYGFIK